jgi:hypothetical protein
MKQAFLILIGIYLMVTSCNSEPDPYLITNITLGTLTILQALENLHLSFQMTL